MKKTKVLMVGNDPSVKGGMASVVSQLLGFDWDAVGVELDFIPTYKETGGIRMVLYFIGQFAKVRKYIRRERPDVVHIHMSYKGSFFRKYMIHRCCMKNGILDIIHLHGSRFSQWYEASGGGQQKRIRRLLRECGTVIVLGEKWDKAVREIEPAAHTVVVSNTVHVPEESVIWNEERFQILFLGVLIKRKGVEDLLKAVKLLKDTGRIGSMRFVIAGTGKEEGALKDFAGANGLNDVVEFAGWAEGDTKTRLLRESQMLVLPSYNEGLPIAVLEAVSFGMPVVATDVGDMSAAVHDGVNGYLIEPGDFESLADRIYRISSDREIYENMKNESKKIAEKSFSDENFFEKILECYRDAARKN